MNTWPSPSGLPSPQAVLGFAQEWALPEIQSLVVFLGGLWVLSKLARTVGRG